MFCSSGPSGATHEFLCSFQRQPLNCLEGSQLQPDNVGLQIGFYPNCFTLGPGWAVGTRVQTEQDEKLNSLLREQGSIAEKTRIASELDDDKLQIAAPYSRQAKVELERRRAELALQAHRRWYARPVGMIAIGAAGSLIAWAILRYFGAA